MRADLDGEKDERLAALAAGGDRDAFDALVTRHRQAVYRLCWSAAGNAADADDAAQETFVRVYRSLPSYDPARPFGPWLRKIAWNCGLSVRRDGNAGVPRVAEGDAPEAVDPAPGPEEAAAGNEERRRVADAMAGLPAELRMVMVLRAVEGLSYAEIALAAGIPAGTVMSRLSRARTRLLAALGARSGGGS
jgi:RNA polymerase sigma-70 factor (ECF subfamily)